VPSITPWRRPAPRLGILAPVPVPRPPIDRLVLLGAAGDLATRHTLPALAHLVADDVLPADLLVVGVGREQLTDESYRALAAQHLADHASGAASVDRLLRRLRWVHADLAQDPDLRTAVGSGPVVAYLALPPAAYAPAVRALGAAGVAAGSRAVVEKPFGQDLATARELTRHLHTVFDESDIFRVDHFLHHQTVQDLLAVRFANPLLAPLWNGRHIERVEITWEETAAVSGRADFYDRTGALRDMVQSHLLQLVALVAMAEPRPGDERSLRDEKVAVLSRVPSLTPAQVATRSARGRYTAGTVGDRRQAGYLEEPGVDRGRSTETHASLVLAVDDPRWHGVPFELRTGKALGAARREIAVHFRSRSGAFLAGGPAVLRLQMSPDRVSLDLQGAGASGLPSVAPLRLEVARPRQSSPASARMLQAVLAGDPTFAVRDDEVEQSWRIVDSVLAGWRTGIPPLEDYPAGSAGPERPRG